MYKAVAALAALPGLLAPAAQAQSVYPAKPVRLVVGQAPGGATDVVARLVAPKLGEHLGQSVVVENRTGAAGSIGAAFVAKSAPDGYNLLVVSSSYAINPSLYTDLPFDPVKDLVPVSLLAEAPFLLVVHPSLPAKSVKELVSFARARPGALDFASGGTGSSGHLAGELFQYLAGIRMVHVPYKGAGPALVDVMAGQVHLTFGSVLSSLGHVRNGRLRALGVTSAKRSSGAPDLPTIAEAGVTGYQRTTWYGLLAPGGTAAPVLTRLAGDMKKAVEAPEVRNRILADGAEPEGGTPEQFRAHLASEMKRAEEIIRRAGVKR
ncbi:MAG: tripartite tricarboxylate transporter substrate binding protein [Burkholderiales bacterium]|nr:tripartite tricarboxylate transporter substrate binding protein [Burkholderiales bacterium]